MKVTSNILESLIHFLKPYFVCILAFVILPGVNKAQVEARSEPVNGANADFPNIIVIVADDLGYGDLACFGHPEIKTPNLDRLAKEGLRLLNCYSPSPVCSPSRAGIMTGRNPNRIGVYDWIPMMSPMHMPSNEIAIPAVLKQIGYTTCMVGKWHLNGLFNLPGQPQPNDFGFDHWFAVQNLALPTHKDPYNFVRNGIPQGPMKGYSGPIVAREAVDWLQNTWDKSNPFFLYVAFTEPHEVIATAERYRSLYKDEYPDDPSRVAYYGNVTQMDDAVGKILSSLDSMGITQNTLVWFTSDNGPARTKWHNAGSTNNLRAYKKHLYEGGIRVPGIIRWPQKIKAGTLSKEAVSGLDIFQTISEIVKVPVPADRVLDGTSILLLFNGNKLNRAKPLFWEYLWASSAPKFVLLHEQWKLLASLDSPQPNLKTDITKENMDFIKNGEMRDFELYNINEDPYERKNLAITYPDKLKELKEIMEQQLHEIQSESPVWPVWKNVPYDGVRLERPDYIAKPLNK